MTNPDDLLAQALQDAYDRGYADGQGAGPLAPLTLADPEPATCGTDCDCLNDAWEAAAKLGAQQDANRADKYQEGYSAGYDLGWEAGHDAATVGDN